MSDDVLVGRTGGTHRVRLRACESRDLDVLEATWVPALERGPTAWLDRDWSWRELTRPDQLRFNIAPEWLVMVDDVAADALGDIVGVLVTTGPVPIARVVSGRKKPSRGSLVHVEYIAIAPSVRDNCPAADSRAVKLKGIGSKLMLAAIARSRQLRCAGRIGLQAEGTVAIAAYISWGMTRFPAAPHPGGGRFPVFLGDKRWAEDFENKRKETKP